MMQGDAFLASFFGPGNEISWKSLQQGAGAAALAPFLELYEVARKDDHGIAMLPRLKPTGELCWYVLSRSTALVRQAMEVIQAYLGPTYSDVGRGTPLSPGDPVDQAVAAHFGSHCFPVRVPREEKIRECVRARLQMLAGALHAHPRRGALHGQTVGRLLHSFEQALDSGDEDAAKMALSELSASGHLNAMNLAYLQVRLDVASGRHETALGRGDLLSLIDAGVPPKVTLALLRAIFVVHLAPHEEQADVAGAIERFASMIEPRFRPLYRTRAGLAGYEVDVQFLLLLTVRGPARDADVGAILNAYEEGSPRRRFLQQIADTLRMDPSPAVPSLPADVLGEARAALQLGDIDRAFALAIEASSSPERTALLLSTALQREQPNDLATAVGAYDALPEDERARFAALPRAEKVLAEARARLGMLSPVTSAPALVPVGPVVDWVSWLQRLTLAEPWVGAVAAANQGAQQWPIEPLASSPYAVQKADLTLRATLPAWALEALLDAAPVLIQAWLKRGPDPRLKQLYLALFGQLIDEGVYDVKSASLLTKLARALISLGMRKADYARLLGQVSEQFRAMASPAIAAMKLDLLEAALDYRPGDREPLQAFANAAADLVCRSAPAGSALRALLATLLSDAAVSVSLPASALASKGADASWSILSTKHVALYAPFGGAAERAQAIIETLSPGVSVSTFTSAEGAITLKDVAMSADVFVLTWGCEGDAAFRQIQSFRPSLRPTLHATGQSASALLSAVSAWVGKAPATSAAPGASSDVMTDDPAVLADIGILRNRLENKLRKFTKHHLSVKLGDAWIKPLLEVVPEQTRKQIAHLPADEILNKKLLFSNLITLMTTRWGKYFSSLEQGDQSKAVHKFHMESLLHFVNVHREDAHAKAISQQDLFTLRVVVPLLENMIDSRLAGL